MYSDVMNNCEVVTCDTPVLLCVFNRPDLTKMAIDNLRAVKPKRLYVSADGPRTEVTSDELNCNLVREQIENVDWQCEVTVRFLSENEGCGKSISGAISWFFEQEEEGIILEDDVLPVPYFFQFAQQMLLKFRDNEEVFMVSGTNLYPHSTEGLNYFFTSMSAAWGWATWRRAWNSYDFNIEDWLTLSGRASVRKKIRNSVARAYLTICFDEIALAKVDTWDYQWQFSAVRNSKVSVTAGQNLVTNIGVLGTHSDGATNSHFLERSEDFRLDNLKLSPDCVLPHGQYERRFLLHRALPVILKHRIRSSRFLVSFFRRRGVKKLNSPTTKVLE